MKTCCNCSKTKSIEEFVKDNRRKDGYSTLCKECKREKDKISYQNKKDNEEFHSKKLASSKKYRESHKEELQIKANEYNNRPETIERKSEWHQKKTYSLSLKSKIHRMCIRAYNRAIEKNLPFNIDEDLLYIPEFCPILEIRLNWSGGPREDGTPSLDRIIPEKGYTNENIRIISNLANMMKNNANKDTMEKFTKNIMKYINNEEIVRTMENEESIELQDKEPVR